MLNKAICGCGLLMSLSHGYQNWLLGLSLNRFFGQWESGFINIGQNCRATRTLPSKYHNLSEIDWVSSLKVCISKPSNGDEDGLDFEEVEEEEVENGETDRPATKVIVTPFLSGVQPAGTLRAKPKPVGNKASGLVQVGITLLLF